MDALGQPFEFCNFQKIKDFAWDGSFKHGDVWNLEPGKYTDDTKMALAIVESLLEKKKFDADNVASKYVAWVRSGDVRGIGLSCERAINKLANGTSPKESGAMTKRYRGTAKYGFKRAGEDVLSLSLTGSGDYCGNGTVMRCAPIGLYFHNDLAGLEVAAKTDATMTHDHLDARDSSYALCYYIARLVNGLNKFEALKEVVNLPKEGTNVHQHLLNAIAALDENLTIEDVSGKLGARGTAHETFATAIYFFLKYPDFKSAVINSIAIGGDTDTRAAIVGALAGTTYGLEGIPVEYISTVEGSERLQAFDKQLFGE